MTKYCLLLAGLLSLAPQNAQAYLDPGTGSYLLQIILASFFSAMFFIKTFWFKIKTFFARLFKKSDPS